MATQSALTTNTGTTGQDIQCLGGKP